MATRVTVFSFTTAGLVTRANFFGIDDANFRGGVRVGVKDADEDDTADVLVGSGDGLVSKVRVYLGTNFDDANEPTTFQDLNPFGVLVPGGIFVG